MAHGYTLANPSPADNQAKPAFHFRNQALTHVPGISLRIAQPPTSESMPLGSPILRSMRIPDSIRAEHALETQK
jgi:hypothetical protein